MGGSPLWIDWTVTNQGTDPTAVGWWLDTVYLSADAQLDETDVALASFPHNGQLGPGNSYTQQRQVNVPGTALGDNFLIVRADASPNNHVFERGREDNNADASAIQLTLPPPADLQVTAVVSPATAWSGQTLVVQWIVANVGAAEATSTQNAWYDSAYLSRDPYLDSNADLHLGAVEHSGALAAGGTYPGSLSARLPAGISGPYYVLVLTDTNNRVAERGLDANNVTAAAAVLQVNLTPPADLQVTGITPPVSGVFGDPAVWQYEVSNLDTLDAMGAWYDTLYLSADQQWDLDDPRIARVRHEGDVPHAEHYTETVTAEIPAVLPGEYYVIVRTDILNELRELDDANNTGVSAQTIQVQGRELPLGQAVPVQLAGGAGIYYAVPVAPDQVITLNLSGAGVQDCRRCMPPWKRCPRAANSKRGPAGRPAPGRGCGWRVTRMGRTTCWSTASTPVRPGPTPCWPRNRSSRFRGWCPTAAATWGK